MRFNNNDHLNYHQALLQQAQALATRLPYMGVSLLSCNDLLGVAAFLKRKYAELEG
jgi:hypothetical protein